MIDVAVIGAGLGGLSAAVHCARAGLSVAVFEANAEAGGFASTWSQGPYTFEGSLHALDSVGPGEPNRRILEGLGIADALDLTVPDAVRTERWPDGRRLVIPAGRAALTRWMEATFSCSVAPLLDQAQAAHGASYRALLDGADVRRGLQGLTGVSGARLLADHRLPPDAVTVLGGITSWQGADLASIAALNLLLLLHGYHVLGGRVPRGGSAALVGALVRELEAHGGTLRTLSAITGVSVGRRRAEGVITPQEEVPARHVVAAIAPSVTFGSLVPAQRVPAPLRRQLAAMVPSGSLLRLTAGLRVAPELPYESLVRGPCGQFGGLSVTARHVLDPGAAPAGSGVISVSTPWPCSAPLTADRKADLTEALVTATEEGLGLALRGQLEEVALAHPGTFARYGGTPGGAVFGHPPLVGQSGARALRAETAIPHLWLAGGWVFPGPGQTAALISGRIAAHGILQSMGRPDGVRGP